MFKENLKTTRFSNGDPIPYSDANSTQPAYTWYEKNLQNKNRYGGLYNWYAVVSDKGLCPEGWHVPDHYEWNAIAAYAAFIASYMNISSDVSVFKSTRTEPDPHPRWSAGGVPTNDLLGFSALPGGARHSVLGYRWIGNSAYFWSASETAPFTGWARVIYNGFVPFYTTASIKESQFSVRCVKD